MLVGVRQALPSSSASDQQLWTGGRNRHQNPQTIEQDYRNTKRLVNPGLGFGAFNTVQRNLKSYEAVAMIRKGQFEGIDRNDGIGQIAFIHEIFGIAA